MFLPRRSGSPVALGLQGQHHERPRFGVLVGTLAVAVAVSSASMAAPGNEAVMPAPDAPGRPGTSVPTTARPGASMSRGVVTPRGDVDPGMATRPPQMPPHSMPVIHPQATGNGGSVVVPR